MKNTFPFCKPLMGKTHTDTVYRRVLDVQSIQITLSSLQRKQQLVSRDVAGGGLGNCFLLLNSILYSLFNSGWGDVVMQMGRPEFRPPAYIQMPSLGEMEKRDPCGASWFSRLVKLVSSGFIKRRFCLDI